MNTPKKTYTTPAITEVQFEDKNLIQFNVCSKQLRIEGDSASCCVYGALQTPNNQPFDLS
jgi:hypothetical protein